MRKFKQTQSTVNNITSACHVLLRTLLILNVMGDD